MSGGTFDPEIAAAASHVHDLHTMHDSAKVSPKSLVNAIPNLETPDYD